MSERDESWDVDLEPPEADPRREVRSLLGLFAAGLGGGVLTLIGLGTFSLPMHTHCHGATPQLRLERELRRECLARGLTPAEVLAGRAAARSRRAPQVPR